MVVALFELVLFVSRNFPLAGLLVFAGNLVAVADTDNIYAEYYCTGSRGVSSKISCLLYTSDAADD